VILKTPLGADLREMVFHQDLGAGNCTLEIIHYKKFVYFSGNQ